jgi:phosphate transport system protein
LDRLKESVLSFGKMAELVFRGSMVAVIDLDVKTAEKMLALEPKVDKFEEGIEVSILDLLVSPYIFF